MKSIYVGNIPFSAMDSSLQEMFEAYGQVNSVKIVADRETGRPRGFAFVEMENDGDADEAISALDGTEWDGRNLRVNEARPRERRGSGGGGYRGGRW